jgi:hypothetical protein
MLRVIGPGQPYAPVLRIGGVNADTVGLVVVRLVSGRRPAGDRDR